MSTTHSRIGIGLIALLLTLSLDSPVVADDATPRTVDELWKEWDPRRAPLDAKVIREWTDEGIVYRYVVYAVGTFKGVKSRVAAFYGFPQRARQLPGLLHLHGGGQRAFLHEVAYYAKRGYACLSINWGGREMERAKAGDPNTDWGAVDPTQRNVSGYFNLKPGDKYLDPVESPRNNNWYLLTLAARRGLTFLERQPEVDRERLGVYGHSMGSNLTVYVAGTDQRVKVSAPSVGGSGFRTYSWPLLPQQRKHTPNGDVRLFRATIGFQSYSPRIEAPLLWLGATNDFHGIMDDTYRTGELIPHEDVRYAFAPHFNHRFTPETAVTRPLWIDQHLKGTFQFPATPKTSVALSTADQIPSIRVRPDPAQPIDRVNIFYSVDPDPQARFWRSAKSRQQGTTWSAALPIFSIDQPLFAFANVHYRLENPVAPPFARPVETLAISSRLHTLTPDDLRLGKIRATDRPSRLIDDFSDDWRDWYKLSADNPHHWQYWTRKISDLKWRGSKGDQLVFDVCSQKPNTLVVLVVENFFRPYRGRNRKYAVEVKLTGNEEWQTVTLSPQDFRGTEDAEELVSWSHLDELGFVAQHRRDRRDKHATLGASRWAGPQPVFRRLRWHGTTSSENGTIQHPEPSSR